MEWSPPWATNISSASQEIPCILWYSTLHLRIHKRPPPLPILNHIIPVHVPTHWRFILILSFHLCLGLPSDFFFLKYPHKIPVCTSHVPHTCDMPPPPPLLVLLDLITCYRSLSSSLCNLNHSSLTSSLLGPNLFLSTLFSNTLSLHSSLSVRDQVSHPYTTMGKIIVLYIT